MSGTFIHPLMCGFARGIAWQIAAQVDADENQKCEDNETRNVYQARLMREMYDHFSNTFKSCKENFPLDLKRFAKHFPNLRVKFSWWYHRKIAERNQFTATFNIQTWNELSPAMKIEHTFQDCKSCQLKYSDTQALFPVKSHRYTGSMKENNPHLANTTIKFQLPNKPCNTNTTLREANETAKSLYDQVNPIFEKATGHSLVNALTKVKDLNIEEKKSKAVKRKIRRTNYRKFKAAVEKEWENTSFVRYDLQIFTWVAGMTAAYIYAQPRSQGSQ